MSILLSGLVMSCGTNQTLDQESDTWDQLPAILAHIKVPEFPDQYFNILDFGAKADGTTNASPTFFFMAIAKKIDTLFL